MKFLLRYIYSPECAKDIAKERFAKDKVLEIITCLREMAELKKRRLKGDNFRVAKKGLLADAMMADSMLSDGMMADFLN